MCCSSTTSTFHPSMSFQFQLVNVALVDASPLTALSRCHMFHRPLSLSFQQDSKCLMRTQTCPRIVSLSILSVNLGSREPVEANTAPSLRFRPNKQEIWLLKRINYNVWAFCVFVCVFCVSYIAINPLNMTLDCVTQERSVQDLTEVLCMICSVLV